jgi:hypothetical protein
MRDVCFLVGNWVEFVGFASMNSFCWSVFIAILLVAIYAKRECILSAVGALALRK